MRECGSRENKTEEILWLGGFLHEKAETENNVSLIFQ